MSLVFILLFQGCHFLKQLLFFIFLYTHKAFPLTVYLLISSINHYIVRAWWPHMFYNLEYILQVVGSIYHLFFSFLLFLCYTIITSLLFPFLHWKLCLILPCSFQNPWPPFSSVAFTCTVYISKYILLYLDNVTHIHAFRADSSVMENQLACSPPSHSAFPFSAFLCFLYVSVGLRLWGLSPSTFSCLFLSCFSHPQVGKTLWAYLLKLQETLS